MTFGVHLGIDFHEIFDFVIICENHRNAYIQSISVGSAHAKSHIFSQKIQSINHTFFDASFSTSFFEILVRLDAKMLDLGIPLPPSWGQNDAQHRPSGDKKHVNFPRTP